MKVKDLIEKLSELPLEADIYIEKGDGEAIANITVGKITEREDDDTVIGYLIYDDKQLDLPFDTAQQVM